MSTEHLFQQHSFLGGGGEMGRLMREHDWASTPLGPISTWPQSLCAAISICLNSRFPIILFWGPDFYQFYNDAYRPILGQNKHPQALGQSAHETWEEIWDVIGPMLSGVIATGVATWSQDQLLLLERNGYLEECYFTFSYSPIVGDAGSVEGVFCAVMETTDEVLGKRRLHLLQALATNTSEARTAETVAQEAASTLRSEVADLPFTLLYLLGPASQHVHLAGSAGLSPGTCAAPAVVMLGATEDVWSLGQVAQSRHPLLLDYVAQRVGELSGYDASILPRPERALVLPLSKPADPRLYGFLVVGLSPYRPFVQAYEDFCHLVTGGITTALTAALAYQQERQRAEALAELDHAKSAFFSNVSHEFRTPLTLSLGPLETLLADREHPLSPEQRAQLEMVHRNELRQLKLVNTLLDFSRIEAGRAEIAAVPIDLAQLTRDLASTFRSVIERAGLQLLVDCPPLPEAISVDPDMWEKIVLNLLSNAFKATFEGTIRVALRLVEGAVELTVQDTGVGISQADLPHLFERFYRVRKARARTHEGTGIGLALVQELVRLHGGSIAVESREGVGTLFTVRLPQGNRQRPGAHQEVSQTLNATQLEAAAYVEEAQRWLPDSPASANDGLALRTERQTVPRSLNEQTANDLHTGQQTTAQSCSASLPASTISSPGAQAHAHLLVADDNADMRDYLKRLLSPFYHVTLVANGSDVLSLTRAILPDLLISDIMMPGLDGLALLKALREGAETATLPVILLSARAGEEAILAGLQAGADDYLIKPFSARELLARVETHLTIARLLEEAQAARAEREVERDRFYHMLTQAPMPLAITHGREQVFELFNEHFQQVTGNRAAIGKTYREVMPELEGQGLFEIIDQVYQSGEPFFAPEYVSWLANAHGKLEERAFNFTHQPLLDTNGKVEAIMQVGYEVTKQVQARRQAEELSRKAEIHTRELETIFEAITDGIFVYDSQGMIVRANTAVRQMLALPLQENYTHLPLMERLALIDLRDERGVSFPEASTPNQRVLRGEVLAGDRAVIMQITTLDGRKLWVSCTGGPIRDAQGQLIGALLVLRDITEQVFARGQLEELARELETTFETITDGFAVYDAHGHTVRTNQAYREMFAFEQLPNAEQVSLVSRLSLLNLRDERGMSVPQEGWAITRILGGEKLTGDRAIELQVRALDGREITVSVTGAPVYDLQGQILEAILLVRDVTERRALQRRTQRSLDALLQIAQVLLEVTTDPTTLQDEAVWSGHIANVMEQTAELTRRVLGCERLNIVTLDEESGLLCPVVNVGVDSALVPQWREETARQRFEDNLSPEQIARLTAGDVIVFNAPELQEIVERQVTREQAAEIIEQLARYDVKNMFCAPLRAGTHLFGLLAGDHGGIPHTYTADELQLAGAIATLITLVLERERLLRERAEGRQHEQTLRARNQQLANLIELAHDAVIVRDLSDTIIFWNEGAERLYGWTSEQALGKRTHTLLQTRFPTSQEEVAAILRGAEGQWEGELEHRHANGEILRVESRQVHVEAGVGLPPAILEINRDITERERLLGERAAAQANARAAAESSRMRDEFISVASHELRTPITSIKGNAQLAARFLKSLTRKLSPDDADLQERVDLVKQLVERIEDQIDLQNRLVGDMVDVSRIQSSKFAMHQQHLDLVAVVRESLENQRLATPERRILFESQAEKAMVLADRARIGQVIGNYLSNALKYSETDHPVQVCLERDDTQVRVSVQDEGPGLTAEAQEHIWERFYRAPGVHDHSGGGADLGLGLYISHTIIEQHNGHVGVTSEIGTGSTFWFTLPLAPADDQFGESDQA